MKGLRVAGATTIEAANRYLDEEFVPWWNQHLRVLPANATDAHRPLGAEHVLASALSRVETRQVANDYTIRLDGQLYQIARQDVRAGLRGANVRIEIRLDGPLAVRFQNRYVQVQACQPQPKAVAPPPVTGRKPPRSRPGSSWLKGFQLDTSTPIWKAAAINKTRTRDVLD